MRRLSGHEVSAPSQWCLQMCKPLFRSMFSEKYRHFPLCQLKPCWFYLQKQLLGRCSKTLDFREREGGIHSINVEAPNVQAGELWKDQSFTPEIAMEGMKEKCKPGKWPTWKRPKVINNLVKYHPIRTLGRPTRTKFWSWIYCFSP